jgi:toxin HigB-1
MELIHFRHKGLRQLHETGSGSGLTPTMADKLRKLLFALETADRLDQMNLFPGWKLHLLKGDQKDFWSLTVTGNWRLISPTTNRQIPRDIDLIDYH